MLSPNQFALFSAHEDMAQFACTGSVNCLMILDLNDERAMEIASAFEDRKKLEEKRDLENSRCHTAASTIAMPIESVNTYRQEIMGAKPLNPPDEGNIYMILCSEGRFQVAEINSLTTSIKTK